MVFALFPIVGLLDAVRAVDREHLVARVLHHEALRRGVDGLVRVRGGVAVHAVAKEAACEIDLQLVDGAGPQVRKERGDVQVARVQALVARVRRVQHAVQLVEQRLVDLGAV